MYTFLFTTRNKVISANNSVNCNCDNCGAQNRIKMSVVLHYLSVFFIPTFPQRKTLKSQCNNCKQILQEFQFPIHFDKEANRLKTKIKPPLWSRAGVLFVPLFFVCIAVVDEIRNDRIKGYLAAPLVGDIYELKIADEEYTLIKVNRVSTDSVYVSESLYITNTAKGLRKIQKKKYDSETFPIAKPALKEMFDERKIIDVDRKEAVINE